MKGMLWAAQFTNVLRLKSQLESKVSTSMHARCSHPHYLPLAKTDIYAIWPLGGALTLTAPKKKNASPCRGSDRKERNT